MACDVCHNFIRSVDPEGLAWQAYDCFYGEQDLADEERADAITALVDLQTGFWDQYDPNSGAHLATTC